MSLALGAEATANTGSGASVTIPLTTQGSSGVIVVLYVGNLAEGANPTAPGLTFTKRTLANPQSGSNFIAEFTAPFTSSFSNTITVNASGSTFITALAFEIKVAATSSIFDANGSLPGSATSGTITYSTSNANDFIFTWAVNNSALGAPWTEIDATARGNFLSNGYQVVSSTQTSQTASATGGGAVDAIVQASAGGFIPAWAIPSNLPVIGTGTY